MVLVRIKLCSVHFYLLFFFEGFAGHKNGNDGEPLAGQEKDRNPSCLAQRPPRERSPLH